MEKATAEPAQSFMELNLLGCALTLSLSEADGFISNSISQEKIEASFSLKIGWTSKAGIYFEGSGGLEISFPTHIQLGIFHIDSLQLGLKTEEGDLSLEASASGGMSLGPLKAVVDRIGLDVDMTFGSGNLGFFGLSPGFKPPNGVGLSVDAGVVKGGGYLSFDFDKGEYAGALELTFSGIVSLKAIGIITTKMPDGSDGFSLLIIITAEFGTGIQLGFGFVLLGVGGLLGLNRTMRLQSLAEGVRTGAINGIMFPTNVVANAPRIISDLRNYFPPEEGTFLIGPMAKLAWGTPALITVSLGIIIEIPGNIAILGVLKVALPAEDAPLIILQINFIGAIEFDKSRLWFFASLYDSRILFVPLQGEMGLLVAWGNDANFVVSVGGFHPAFNPPPLPFPNPVRLSFNVLNEPFGRIRVMAYFAVTSNTVQFGAHAELFFGLSKFKIEGHIGFDALFQFSPFYFIIQVSGSLSVKVFGVGFFSVRVKMSLEGPTPYRAKGTGSISLFFFDIDVDFDVTWGESQNTTLPPIEVMPLLKREFDKLENWKAQLPPGTNILVSLRKIDTAAELVLHPVGTLSVSQRYVPLDLTIDKIGAQKPGDVKKFVLSPAGTSGLGKKGDVKESFAMAQFQEMKNTEKLSRPSFEKEDGGLELSVTGQQVTTGKAVKRIVRYELIVIDTNFKRFARKFFDFISGVLFLHFLKGNAVANSPLSFKTKKQYQPFEEKVEVKQAAYSVEMGLLVAWGNDANFVVSVGGFHPAFNPPPLPFPNPVRLSFNVLNEPFGRIRVMAYFAVTSNTVQFGAHAELFFGLSKFKIEGHIGFDALFQFSPFYFIIQVSGSLSVKVFGVGFFSVRVKMSLEGPTPYRAKGTGSISLFFFDIDVDFDVTWGESQNTTLPPIEVMPLLKREFDKLENWKAQLPPGTNILVSLRKIDTAAELVLHPVGTLSVSQRYVPLDLTIDKIGAQKPGDVKKFVLSPAGTSGLGKKGDVKESFAMAQFQEMKNTEKLSRPSFEKEDGGLELSVTGQQVTTGKAVKRIVRYELIVIDTNFKRFARKFFDFISGVLFLHFLKGNAVANSPLSFKTKKQYQPFEEKVEVKQAAYSVANVMNNKAYNANAISFASEALAREFIQQQAKADPNLKDNLHIVLQHELNTAA